ncbi:MAG TPA: bifunctional 3-deoxy-7-phosphoheptulonate synthase/chorismate mutase [Candidatus Acidoferrales bacterium]|jgi:3-deoxy-7-phosphoheptulonate synthase|nr:bifunctional 3-deoxy-7-phosphoheptulonate synthase/chorismate mutase [Candidatus Acidoferrales bacterium]
MALYSARKGFNVGLTVGGINLNRGFHIIAGPCSVESAEQMNAAATVLAGHGVRILRGGAFKPRTSPYSFQGLADKGLELLAEAARSHGMISISEVMDTDSIELVAAKVDIIQVGARNMQNFSLLKRLAKQRKPVLLKRGMSASVEEFLLAAEYVLQGNDNVILCERGVRSFETMTRNMLDLAGVALMRRMSHLPVIVDLSHSTGRVDIVPELARACVALGAEGIMVEVHPDPQSALSDADQAMPLDDAVAMIDDLRPWIELRERLDSQASATSSPAV